MEQKITKEKIVEWLNRQWQGPKICPICRNNNWHIIENPVELREFHGGTLVVGGPVYPLISVTCSICGYTLLFNAIVARLLIPEQKNISDTAKGNKSVSTDMED